MSLTSILSSGRSSLIAHQSAIATTSHNTANAATVGFSRRDINFAPGAEGSGVTIEAVTRRADVWVERRVLLERTEIGTQESRSRSLSSVELRFTEQEGAIGDSLDALFASVRALQTDPTDAQLREEVLARGSFFVSSMQTTSIRVSLEREQADQAVVNGLSEVNELAADIAELNAAIRAAEADGTEASDDRDRRDKLIGDLADVLEITSFFDDRGDAVVLLAGGASLVQGTHANQLTATADANYDGYHRVDLVDSSGLATDVTTILRRGELGGLVELRDVFFNDLEDRLDQLAFDISTSMNAVHSAGYGLDGVTGRDFFAAPAVVAGAAQSLSLDPALAGDPDAIAAATTFATSVGGNDNLVAWSDLEGQLLASGGVRTFGEEISAMIATIGQEVSENQSRAGVADVQLAQLQAIKESVTGVSLDEELLDISRFQRAYQAATRIIETVNLMYDTLLQL